MTADTDTNERTASNDLPATAALFDRLDAADKRVVERIAKEGGR